MKIEINCDFDFDNLAEQLTEKIQIEFFNILHEKAHESVYKLVKKISKRVIVDHISGDIDILKGVHVFEIKMKWKHDVDGLIFSLDDSEER